MSEEQKERLLDEARELAIKLNALNSFMAKNECAKLPRDDKDLLYSQQRVMSRYLQILGKRLENAEIVFTHK